MICIYIQAIPPHGTLTNPCIDILLHYIRTETSFTTRGKILEGENFGELMALKSLARKNLANLLVVY